MRKIDEMFENDYIIDDAGYLEYYCVDPAEAYSIEKDLMYSDDLWLFNKPEDGLEDNYGEESMP